MSLRVVKKTCVDVCFLVQGMLENNVYFISDGEATMVVDHIAYHKLDERYDSTIFAERIPGNVGRALETSRCIQDYVFWDSEGERCDVVHSYEDLLTVIQGTD